MSEGILPSHVLFNMFLPDLLFHVHGTGWWVFGCCEGWHGQGLQGHLGVFAVGVCPSNVLAFLMSGLHVLVCHLSCIDVVISWQFFAPPIKPGGSSLFLLLSSVHSLATVYLCQVGATCAHWCWFTLPHLLWQGIWSPSRIHCHLPF